MLRAISLRESWMREIRTSGLTRERAPNGPSLLYNSIFDLEIGLDLGMRRGGALLATPGGGRQAAPLQRVEDEFENEDDLSAATPR